MYKIFRSLLFLLPAEKAHHAVLFLIKSVKYVPCLPCLLKKILSVKNDALEKEVFGLTFKNPIGFAAGFDKNAEIFDILGNFGFAFVEIGTVTPKSQPGNPKPRSFRLKKDNALINRMGFNNDGLAIIIKRLRKKSNRTVIVGGNIGKNTMVPNTDAVSDYLKTFKGLYDYVDYFTVNVSCPNVGNLTQLQNKTDLEILLKSLANERKYMDVYKPVLVKISPDLSFEQIDDTLYIIRETGIDGVVATNTTTSREGLKTSDKEISEIGQGGLSGQPLTRRSLEIVRYIHEQTSGKLPIIAVGGIMTVADAVNMIDAGADLIQLYTGYIYQGPCFVKKIQKTLIKLSRNHKS
ncbi:MAG: quinone-dependent dihydroorotate dehydrogenase [Prevotellaceae bacterium]|jgi:dihydroorotate dehydrogenase|nr:quinone-dependent dihydroorotate dehydrogenase [Prevotellaceae bacterium]